ncbi:hypothetical protein QA599_19135 [Haloarculaceae archaeon H-GB1-1]|nr:hypothetical protein [Haloarculaceae archaeon H-GB1-1]
MIHLASCVERLCCQQWGAHVSRSFRRTFGDDLAAAVERGVRLRGS